MRLSRVQFVTRNRDVFFITNEEDWMVSIHKPNENGPGFIVPKNQRPPKLDEVWEDGRRMLTPFAEKLAERAAEMFVFCPGEMEQLVDTLLTVLPDLL